MLRLPLLLLVLLAGCGRVSPYEALPPVGSALPEFDFPLLSGGRLTPAALEGTPTVVALWSSTCGFSQKALSGLEQLRRDYESRGARVIVLADDADPEQLRQALDRAGVNLEVAYTSERLKRTFDPSAGPLGLFSSMGLPSFLVLNSEGVVVRQAAGVRRDEIDQEPLPLAHLRTPLDSLLALSR